MQHNLPLLKLTTGQNQAKVFKTFICISKIIPWDPQANGSNLIYGGSQMQTRTPRFLL